MVQIVLHVIFAKTKTFLPKHRSLPAANNASGMWFQTPPRLAKLIPNRELTTEWGAFFGANGLDTVDLLLSGKGQPFEGRLYAETKSPAAF